MDAAADLSELGVAVRASAARLAMLLRRVRRADAPALGSWDLTDLAVHVAHVLEGVTALARGGGPLIDDLWELPAFTTMLVDSEGERDLAVLAGRIEASAATFVQVLEDVVGGEPRPWVVAGVDVVAETLAGHVLNELVVHGWDIARAEGEVWPIPDRHAALVLDTFLLPIIGHLGRSLVDQEEAADVWATYDVRVRGGGRFLLRFGAGDAVVEPVVPGAGPRVAPIDCHLSVDPAAFLLVAWGRASQWPAIARGRFLAWGRRPWLGLRLQALLRNP